jgi:general secretion pathway protein E
VRILCPHCKDFVKLDLDAWLQLTQPWEVAPPERIARPVGCPKCRETGYIGRQGIYEVLVNSRAVQAQIRPQLNVSKIREIAMGEGMRTLRLSGAARVARGETTIEEVMRVAPQLEV